jgi:hypothetical protein
VYSSHPWDMKKAAVRKRCLIKLRFRLVVDKSNWLLLTGGCYTEVVVKAGLAVQSRLNNPKETILFYFSNNSLINYLFLYVIGFTQLLFFSNNNLF